jgi:hypothetical protein
MVRPMLLPVGAPIDVGGAPMATRMVGGFILVAFLLCLLLAWPGRRRWPLWLIAGLCSSICAALAFSITAVVGWFIAPLRLTALALAAGFLATAALRDLRDPLR